MHNFSFLYLNLVVFLKPSSTTISETRGEIQCNRGAEDTAKDFEGYTIEANFYVFLLLTAVQHQLYAKLSETDLLCRRKQEMNLEN